MSTPALVRPAGPGHARPPALHVTNGKMDINKPKQGPQQGREQDHLPPEWRVLIDYRDGINRNLASVGRIQNDSVILGTGFLVARNIVMTARHVAESFTMDVDGIAKIRVGWDPMIDFDGETGPGDHHDGGKEHVHADNHARCGCGRIRSAIYMHPHLDLALLRISFPFPGPERWGRPQPLKLTTEPPDTKTDADERPTVYLIGFPRDDGTMVEDEKKVFDPPLGVKRVQPGHITEDPTAGVEFQHDASTLRGNSGSCVIDLATHQVVGLHFRGSRERQNEKAANRAIPFWLLSEEDKTPLRKAGIELA